jgi:sterol desaturase/sphingolipid hydroxylase (fatty acid hydroxylase superfamily)
MITEQEFELGRGAAFVVAALVALALERALPHSGVRASWRVNAALWVVDAVVMRAVCGACAVAVAQWAARAGVGLFHLLEAPVWVAVAVTLPALDLVSYGWHRANHRISALWRFHRVHHSDPTFTATTAVRFHPGELVLSLPLRLGAVVLLGAPPLGVLAFEVVFTLANLLEHSDLRLPLRLERWLALALVTPALHRRHHSIVRAELDSNFGTVFSLWDRALRTYGASSSARRFAAGLPGGRSAGSVREALLLPFTRA